MIVCTDCGHRNEDGDDFCGSCGAFLEFSGERTATEEIVAEVEEELDEEHRPTIVERVKAAVGMGEDEATVGVEQADPAAAAAAVAGAGATGGGTGDANGATPETDEALEIQRRAEEEAQRRAADAQEAAEAATVAAEEARQAAEAEARRADEAEARQAAEREARQAAEQAAAEAREEALRAAEAAARAAEEAVTDAAERARADTERERAETEQGEADRAALAAAEAETARQAESERVALAAAEEEARQRADAEAREAAEREAREAAEAARHQAEEQAKAAEAARLEAEARAREAEQAARMAALVAKPAPTPAPPPADPVASTTSVPTAASDDAAGPAARQPEAVKPQKQKVKRAKPTTAPDEVLNPGDLICGKCGAGNDPDRRFCRRCGTSLVAAAVVPKKAWYKRIFRRKPKAKAEAGTRPQQGGPRKPGLKSRVQYAFLRGRSATRKFGKIGALLALVGVAGLSLGPWRDSAGEQLGKLKRMVIPEYEAVRPAGATATSEFADHPATDAIDQVRNSYWAEGAEGTGEGQVLTFTFRDPVDLDRLGFINGASAKPEDFVTQPRLREVQLDFLDADGVTVESSEITLSDKADFQEHGVKAREVSTVQMEIVSVYPSLEGSAAALAEIEFFAKR